MNCKRVVVFLTLVSRASGSLFGWGSDVSGLLDRIERLEAKVLELESRETKTLDLQGLAKKIESQQGLIETLETIITTSRMLSGLDQECYLTFFNETGTPTCLVNYHLTAEHGLDVMGDARFAEGGMLEVHAISNFTGNATFVGNVTVVGNTTFEGNATFYGNATFEGNVSFFDDVLFEINSTVTHEGLTEFHNYSDFYKTVRFHDRVYAYEDVTFERGADVIFKDTVTFYEDVTYEHGAEVHFDDKVFFYDEVTVDGPSSGSIAFTVKDRVDVRFLQTLDMFVETETWFRENVNIKEKECSSSGKGGCSHPPTIPELCVSGDIIALSDIIVENGEIQVDTIRPFYPSTVVNVQGALTATGDITSLTGVVSPTDPADIVAALAGQNVSVNKLMATEDVQAGNGGFMTTGSLLADGNVVADADLDGVGDVTVGTLILGPLAPVAPGATLPTFDATWLNGLLDGMDITVNSLTATSSVTSNGSIQAQNSITTVTGNFIEGVTPVSSTSVTASDIAALDLTGVGLHINSLYVNQTVTASRFSAFETIEAGGDISTSAGSFVAAGVPLPTSGGGSGASSPLTAADFAGSDLSSVSLTVASITAGSITSGGNPVLTSVSASDLEGLALTNIASLQVNGNIETTSGDYLANGVTLDVP